VSPKANGAQNTNNSYGNPLEPKKTCSVLNLSDKMKFLHLLEGGRSLPEVRRHHGENESASAEPD
jgi:hypothetical protein